MTSAMVIWIRSNVVKIESTFNVQQMRKICLDELFVGLGRGRAGLFQSGVKHFQARTAPTTRGKNRFLDGPNATKSRSPLKVTKQQQNEL